MKKNRGLTQKDIVIAVMAVLIVSVAIVYLSQFVVEQNALSPPPSASKQDVKDQREIDKLAAEIRQIRSDTAGSLFWLKLIALFVTVGGAVGGYLIGQSQTTQARIDFEKRNTVDSVYQSMVQELAKNAPILRATAAVKLGTLLESFPHEWDVAYERRKQLLQLTKNVLAASLAIESDPKVLKTLTIAIVLHRPWKDDPELNKFGDLRNIDLSGAKARDAYWARVDFSYADFYRAELIEASFRESILRKAQFREAYLNRAIMIKAKCEGANFKMADLRGADLTDANLREANFDGTKVWAATLHGAIFENNPDVKVDVSPEGNGSSMVPFRDWLSQNTV